MLRDPLHARPVGSNDVQVQDLESLPPAVCEWLLACASGRKRNPFSVRRPRGPERTSGSRGQRSRTTIRKIQDPEICGPSAAGTDEDELFAIWRERCLVVVGGVVCHLLETGSVGIHAEQICRPSSLGSENDRRSV